MGRVKFSWRFVPPLQFVQACKKPEAFEIDTYMLKESFRLGTSGSPARPRDTHFFPEFVVAASGWRVASALRVVLAGFTLVNFQLADLDANRNRALRPPNQMTQRATK